MLLKRIVLGVFLFLALSFFCSIVFADTVTLKSGQVVEGKIVENTDKYVKMDFNGVELTYFKDEVASIDQGGVNNNAARKELTSLYEAFNASSKAVENKEPAVEPVEVAQPVVSQVDQSVQNTAETEPVTNIDSGAIRDPSAAVQDAISKLPKEYQDMVKSSLEKMQPDKKTQESTY